jgi:hypothetical protein
MIRRTPSQEPQQNHPPRRQAKATFKKVDLKRAVEAAQRVGLRVGSVEIRPDGTISLSTLEAAQVRGPSDAFTEWAGRL